MTYPDLQIDWLRAFVAVVDTGSLSAAAPLLYRSQSAVSMQIKKLETVLGRSVLLRGPRQMEITPTGIELLTYARRMLELQAEAHAALFGPNLTGKIRLGVPDDYASTYLTPVLRSFASRYLDVEIDLTCEQSTSLIPKVQRGELDVVLVSQNGVQNSQFLFDEPLVWVGATQYEVWRRDPLPIAVYETDSLARVETLSALSTQNRSYRIVYHSSSLEGQIAAVESGLAIAVLTRCSVPDHLKTLHNLPVGFSLPVLGSMSVAVLRSDDSLRSPAVDAIYEQMVRTLSSR